MALYSYFRPLSCILGHGRRDAGDAVGSTVVGIVVVGPDVDLATVGFDAVGEMDGESDGDDMGADDGGDDGDSVGVAD